MPVIDLSINVPPVGNNKYTGVYYTIFATGGFSMEQGFATIKLASQNPINQFDVTQALQVKLDVRAFNRKLGLVKDYNNHYIIDSSFNYMTNRFPIDTITISASEFVNSMTSDKVISLGTYTTVYSDFMNYVNTYFGYAGGFSSLFASVSQFDINAGVFDASGFINIINGKSTDASGAYINNLTGAINIYNINNLITYAVDGNVFANRDPVNGMTASDPNNPSNYGLKDGFMAGDLIFIPTGTTITLKLSIESENYNPTNNIGPANVNQVSNYTQKYGSSYYTESTSATLTNINRVLTAPLLIKLDNLS